MSKIKSIRSSILGTATAVFPLLFTVCKSGACTAVCILPLSSLLGITSISLASIPWIQSLYPLFLILSSVSFSMSYFRLYMEPKFIKSGNNCEESCACDTLSVRRSKLPYVLFWGSLIFSISLFV